MAEYDNKAFKAMNDSTASKADNIITKTPSKEEVYNFLQVAIADKVFGGKMDPVEGAGWRSGDLKDPFGRKIEPMDLKNIMLGSGAVSKEGYAKKYGVNTVDIDTLSYDSPQNFKFNITSPDDPNLNRTLTQTGQSRGNPNISGFSFDIDTYKDAYLKRKHGDDPFAKMDDTSSDDYNKFMKSIDKMYKKDTFIEDILGDSYYKEKFDLYSKSFGSK